MDDHPSTIEGALKWARVAKECFGDEAPDMGSVALQTLASECLALRARAEKAEVALGRVQEALTPSAETKGAYIGEFSFNIKDVDEDGEEVTRKVDVPWTTVKEIMAAIRKRAALAGKGE